MSDRYPSYQICHRRFQERIRLGTFKSMLRNLGKDMKERSDFDLTEYFINGTFVIAIKGGPGMGKTNQGKGSKIMAVTDRTDLPVALPVSSASLHENTHVSRFWIPCSRKSSLSV